MYVHIDCNSFFASCEIATREGIADKPVVVANDNEAGGGIVLALNDKAKRLGLRRGNPLFQVRGLLKANDVVVCPVDHKKYRAISKQIMDNVRGQEIVLDFVQYSVDEFFGMIPVEDPQEVRHYVAKVRDHIVETTGIPVGCGCSLTYTLAKTATYFAKHFAGYDGICVLPADKIDKALELLAVGEVWGIGRQHREKLERMGVGTALDFVALPEGRVGEMLGAMGLRTYRELNGIPSIDLHRSEMQKSIMQSRTFPFMIAEKQEMAEQLRGFVASCCTKLRAQNGVCSGVNVFVATNRHRQDLPQYHNSMSSRFVEATSDTPVVTKRVLTMLESLFRPGYQYKQAGVVLTGIKEVKGMQLDLFSAEEDAKRRKLMEVADMINQKFGDDTINFG